MFESLRGSLVDLRFPFRRLHAGERALPQGDDIGIIDEIPWPSSLAATRLTAVLLAAGLYLRWHLLVLPLPVIGQNLAQPLVLGDSGVSHTLIASSTWTSRAHLEPRFSIHQ